LEAAYDWSQEVGISEEGDTDDVDDAGQGDMGDQDMEEVEQEYIDNYEYEYGASYLGSVIGRTYHEFANEASLLLPDGPPANGFLEKPIREDEVLFGLNPETERISEYAVDDLVMSLLVKEMKPSEMTEYYAQRKLPERTVPERQVPLSHP
jgi:hypothetical protein